jgi:hypothetical protein
MNPFAKKYPKLGAMMNPGAGGITPPAAAPVPGMPGVGGALGMPNQGSMPKGAPLPGIANPGAFEGFLKKRRGM